ncbi:hypothetical protein BJI49_11390 [Acetobacter pasteurianus]|nr:hypothetical protein BJI49_11390 [Acetobacter pasteurianus]
MSTGRVAVINSDASVAYTGLGNVVDGTTSGSVTNYGSISASTADIDVSTNGTFYNYGTVSSVDDVRANTSGVIVLGTSSVLKATGYFDVSTNGSLTVDKNATLSVAGTFNNSTYGIVTINGGTVSTSGRLITPQPEILLSIVEERSQLEALIMLPVGLSVSALEL